jgi:hypothetical protein
MKYIYIFTALDCVRRDPTTRRRRCVLEKKETDPARGWYYVPKSFGYMGGDHFGCGLLNFYFLFFSMQRNMKMDGWTCLFLFFLNRIRSRRVSICVHKIFLPAKNIKRNCVKPPAQLFFAVCQQVWITRVVRNFHPSITIDTRVLLYTHIVQQQQKLLFVQLLTPFFPPLVLIGLSIPHSE